MAAGSLHPDNITPGPDRRVPPGHGIDTLGPSDSSDSGSDLKGAPGLARQVDGFGLDKNPMDLEESSANNTAGPDVGDAEMDADSDSGGTGERKAAGRDSVTPDGADIAPDKIETIDLPDQSEDDED